MNIFTNWLSANFPEMTPKEFLREIFPKGELDKRDAMTKGKYTAIACEVCDDVSLPGRLRKDGTRGQVRPKVRRYTLTDELCEMDELVKSKYFVFASPISYAGKARTAENARVLYGLAFDLDHIRISADGTLPSGLINLWEGHVLATERLPQPTMVVSSGTGVHLYYVLEDPQLLWEKNSKQLQILKHELTRLIWHETIVDIKKEDEIQFEGIYQGFRLPGTATKETILQRSLQGVYPESGGERVRAFRTGKPVSVEYLNGFVDEEFRVKDFSTKSDRLEECRNKYPDWYEDVIINHNPKNPFDHPWAVNRAFYEWVKKKIYKHAVVGKRYHCLYCLSVAAQKCSYYDSKKNPNPVTEDELQDDCLELMQYLELFTKEDPDPKKHFTLQDMYDAMEAFQERWILYPRENMESRSGIPMPPNKRNGRTQLQHLQLARVQKAELHKIGLGAKNKGGRPRINEEEIEKYQEQHPAAAVSEISRETGISRATVYNYLAHLPEKPAKKKGAKEKILDYLAENPTADVQAVVKATGVCRSSVYRYYKVLSVVNLLDLPVEKRKEILIEEIEKRLQPTLPMYKLHPESFLSDKKIEQLPKQEQTPARCAVTEYVQRYADDHKIAFDQALAVLQRIQRAKEEHLKLPKYYVISTDPEAMQKMMNYQMQGIAFSIIIPEEYEVMVDNEKYQSDIK